MRQIRMLRAMRRELETGLRLFLDGHAGGNPGYSQGAAYGLPRQFPALPGGIGPLSAVSTPIGEVVIASDPWNGLTAAPAADFLYACQMGLAARTSRLRSCTPTRAT